MPTLFVYAIDAGRGGGNTLLGSCAVVVPAPPTGPAPGPVQPKAPVGKVLLVGNRVTNGSIQMREDPTPVRLTTKPWINCGAATSREQSVGRVRPRTRPSAIQLFTSHPVLQVKLSSGKTGFVSGVWINKKDRGGLGLPRC